MFGIADLSVIPLRDEPSDKSEMVSQLLFGEQYEIIEEGEKWTRIRTVYDNYEGWMDTKMVKQVSNKYIAELSDAGNALTSETFNLVNKLDLWGNKLLVPGSNLPYFNKDTKEFRIGDDVYFLNANIVDYSKQKDRREAIINCALKYFNAPYLWGGRTPYGIDCSGLTQIVYKLNGICLPRDAGQQVECGNTLSFVEEALPGDLAFFGDEEGAITHVGIIWKYHKIIHASGKVRIDNVDHQGIYNEELKRYTHSLRTIKRIIV